MGLSDFFRGFSGNKNRSFDDIKKMVTRPLPVIGSTNPKDHLLLIAKRNRDRTWSIFLETKTQYDLNHKSLKMSVRAIQDSMKKHTNYYLSSELRVNFDAALMVLRETEEAHLKYTGKTPGEEPSDHYMEAFRSLPAQFRESLEEVYKTRLAQGDILPAPANKAPPSPRP